MKNILVLKCRKLIPLGYIAAQILLSLSTWTLMLNFHMHLAFLVIATMAYFAVSLKDPGYVKYQSQSQQQNQLKSEINSQVSSPQKISSLIHSPQSSDAKENQLKRQPESNIIQLGLQSKLQQPQSVLQAKQQLKVSLPKSHFRKYDKVHQKLDCIIQGQIGLSLVVEQSSGFTPIPSALRQIKRWCKQCKGYQQLRVRHCMECHKCIHTFDHHCPWINNCIGQKNKLLLIFYLFLQLVQLIALVIDLGIQLQVAVHNPALVLWLTLACLSVMILGVLGFQCFIICLNITTWEQLRWTRIQYLMIFSQKQLVSLFDRGCKANLSVFFRASCVTEGVKWQQHVNPNASSCLVPSKSNTERRLSVDQG